MQIYLGGEEAGGIRQEVRTSDDDFRGFRDFRSEPQARRGGNIGHQVKSLVKKEGRLLRRKGGELKHDACLDC